MRKRKILCIAALLFLFQLSACDVSNYFDFPFGNVEQGSQDGEQVDGSDSDGEENGNNVCVVIFDTAGGTLIESQTVVYGEKLLKPSDPTKPPDSKYEYVFAGWSFENQEWDFEKNIVQANMTLTAKWEVESIYTPPFTPSD